MWSVCKPRRVFFGTRFKQATVSLCKNIIYIGSCYIGNNHKGVHFSLIYSENSHDSTGVSTFLCATQVLVLRFMINLKYSIMVITMEHDFKYNRMFFFHISANKFD